MNYSGKPQFIDFFKIYKDKPIEKLSILPCTDFKTDPWIILTKSEYEEERKRNYSEACPICQILKEKQENKT